MTTDLTAQLEEVREALAHCRTDDYADMLHATADDLLDRMLSERPDAAHR
jgi:hypothetical protein